MTNSTTFVIRVNVAAYISSQQVPITNQWLFFNTDRKTPDAKLIYLRAGTQYGCYLAVCYTNIPLTLWRRNLL